jgi:hypothetical protein
MIRFSIRTLLVVVVVAAMCAAALLRQSACWASALVSLVLLFCIAGTVVAWLKPESRLFWVPFCLVGCPYFFIALVDSRFTRISAGLVTTRRIFEIWSADHYDEMIKPPRDIGLEDLPRQGKEKLYYLVVTMSVGGFEQILFLAELVPFRIFYFTLQSIFCLALAAGAGAIVSFFARTSRSPTHETHAV